MRLQQLEVERLLPIQITLNEDRVFHHTRQLLMGEDVDPIHTVPLIDGDPTWLIVADGHHKTRAAHDLGRVGLGFVHETTESLMAHVGLQMGNWGLTTIEDFRQRYSDVWLPMVTQAGIQTVLDIPIRWLDP